MSTEPSDLLVLTRDVEAVLIPAEASVTLKAGNQVRLVQATDTHFTVRMNSGLARIDRRHADALGTTVARPSGEAEPPGAVDEEMVWKQLRTCFDPEIPVNIVDLGLIYDCRIAPQPESGGAKVEVKMTLTAPGCSMGEYIKMDVEQKIMSIPGVSETLVELVWDPPWNQNMMTEAARLELGLM